MAGIRSEDIVGGARLVAVAAVIALAAACGNDARLPVEPPPPPLIPAQTPFVSRVHLFSPDGETSATLLPGQSIELWAYAEDADLNEVLGISYEWNYEIVDGSPDGGVSIQPTAAGARITAESPTAVFITATPKNPGFASASGAFGIRVRLPRKPFIWSAEAGMRQIPTPGNSEGDALAINNSGEVVGWYAVDGTSRHAFIWSDKDGFRDIHPPVLGRNSSARAINESGMAAGMTETSSGFAFTWKAGRWDAIGLGQGVSTRMIAAFGINEAGDVAGEAFMGNVLKPVVWSQEGGLTALRDDVLLAVSRPTDINNNGQVVGYAAPKPGTLPGSVLNPAPVVWTSTSAKATPLSPPHLFDGCGRGWHSEFVFGNQCAAVATAINDENQIAGTIGWQAFRSTSAGDKVLFPDQTLASAATTINNVGDVAGNVSLRSIEFPSTVKTAFIWSAAGVVRKLGTLAGMTSSYANGMNDRGQVVGYVE